MKRDLVNKIRRLIYGRKEEAVLERLDSNNLDARTCLSQFAQPREKQWYCWPLDDAVMTMNGAGWHADDIAKCIDNLSIFNACTTAKSGIRETQTLSMHLSNSRSNI